MQLAFLQGFSNNKSKTSFGALQFELDKPTKNYIVKLAQEEKFSTDDILQIAESADIFVKKLTKTANTSAQKIIDNSDLKGMNLEEVWPDNTVVKINIKPKRTIAGSLLLNASFNDSFNILEDSDNLYNPHGKDREKINIYCLWNFLSDLHANAFQDGINHFVEKTMKKQSKFKELIDTQNQALNATSNEKEDLAKQQIQKWIDA